MARTKDKKGKKGGSLVRAVRTKEDRKRPSVFHRLKEGEAFRAVALFEPDPEVEDNPGYFEYYDHYDRRANQYVPCSGDRCPFCAANDNPSTRAITAWFFPDNEKGEQIKLFTMNFSTINEITDEGEESGGVIGRKVRIKRMDDRGDYRVRILDGKPLTKKAIAAALKELAELFPNGLEGHVEKQLKAQMERLKALDAMEDDEDEDETPKARRGKAISDDDEDDEDEEDEEEDEDEDEDEDDEDEDEDSDEDEEDEDEEESDEDEDEDDEDDEEEEEESSEISGTFEVVKANEREETLDVKDSDGNKLKLYAGEGTNVAYDGMKKGVAVTATAEKDDEGDWVITKISKPKAPKGSSKKESSKKPKGGKKK